MSSEVHMAIDWEIELSKPLFQASPEEITRDSKIASATPWYSGDWTYAIGYRTAADTLIDQFGQGFPYYWQTHIYPICFLYRHSIEVALKHLINMLIDFSDIKATKQLKALLANKHSLLELWDAYSIEADRVSQDEVKEEQRLKQLMRERMSEFEDIDPYSFNFRYATIRSTNILSVKDGWKVDLENLKDRMNIIWKYLDGSFSWADHLLEEKWNVKKS